MESENEKKTTQKPKMYHYEKLSEGEYEGFLLKNTKSVYQPSYTLLLNSNDSDVTTAINITGTPAEQIYSVENEVLNKFIRFTTEAKFSKKYKTTYLTITDMVVINKEHPQRKLTVRYEE